MVIKFRIWQNHRIFQLQRYCGWLILEESNLSLRYYCTDWMKDFNSKFRNESDRWEKFRQNSITARHTESYQTFVREKLASLGMALIQTTTRHSENCQTFVRRSLASLGMFLTHTSFSIGSWGARIAPDIDCGTGAKTTLNLRRTKLARSSARVFCFFKRSQSQIGISALHSGQHLLTSSPRISRLVSTYRSIKTLR